MKYTLSLTAGFLGVLTSVAQAGNVDAAYLSREADRPIVIEQEPPPGVPLPPFKVFIVRHGTCPPGEIERYVSGSAQLGAPPSRSCIS